MLKEQIKSRIESFANEIFETNPFFQKSESGKLGEAQIKYYLNNIFYLFQRTTLYLNLAADVAEKNGQKELAHFFCEKQGEEIGHDKWAQSDLRQLGERADNVDKTQLSPHIERLMDYIASVIKHDPKNYLSYMVFAEYFTVLLAPRFLNNLEKNCNIPRSAMSSIEKHGELDKDHALEDFLAIDKFIGSQPNETFVEVLNHSIKEVDRFFNDLGAL